MNDLLALHNITVRYGRGQPAVLADLSLTIQRGEFIGLAGPNGSGKTTLLKIISGVLAPDAGSILLDGQPLAHISRRALARRIAVLPQNVSFLFPFSVMEVVLMGRAPHHSAFSLEGDDDVAVARACLERTETTDLANRSILTLSGGELQRVALARALAQEPEILLLDEPTAHQDLRHQLDIFELVMDLHDTRGLTVLAVSHELSLLARYSKRLLLIHNGHVVADGSPKDVVTPDRVQEVYGVTAEIHPHPHGGSPLVLPIRRTDASHDSTER